MTPLYTLITEVLLKRVKNSMFFSVIVKSMTTKIDHPTTNRLDDTLPNNPAIKWGKDSHMNHRMKLSQPPTGYLVVGFSHIFGLGRDLKCGDELFDSGALRG